MNKSLSFIIMAFCLCSFSVKMKSEVNGSNFVLLLKILCMNISESRKLAEDEREG